MNWKILCSPVTGSIFHGHEGIYTKTIIPGICSLCLAPIPDEIRFQIDLLDKIIFCHETYTEGIFIYDQNLIFRTIYEIDITEDKIRVPVKWISGPKGPRVQKMHSTARKYFRSK